MIGYRKELKYIVDDAVLSDVHNRISGLMNIDSHQKSGFYKVRSLYFDSPALTSYRENLSGISTREKYRIRTYECDPDALYAEVKIRHRETVSKINAPIRRELFDAIANGKCEPLIKCADTWSGTGGRTLEKYLQKIMIERYRPAVIVDYERSAFVYETGNVRITFDRNVFASTEYDRMFDRSLTGRPALDGARHILEIKYDEFLPGEIAGVLSGLSLSRCSCSKYVFCMNKVI